MHNKTNLDNYLGLVDGYLEHYLIVYRRFVVLELLLRERRLELDGDRLKLA